LLRGEKMSIFSNLTIKSRLALGFGVVLALMVIVAWLGYSRMQEVQGRLENITSGTMVKIKLATTMRDAVRNSADSVRNLALLIDENPLDVDLKRIVTERKIYDEAAAELSKMSTSEADKALLATIAEARQRSGPLVEKVLTLAKEEKNAEGTAVWKTDLHPVEIKWQAMLEELVQLQDRGAAAVAAAARTAYQNTVRLLLILTLVSIAFGVTIAIWIIGAITRPLNRAVNVSHAVAAGDLSMAIEAEGKDETAQLLNALAEMKDNLVKIVSGVRQNAERVAAASGEIAQGNMELSSRTEAQASSLEETSASMEELNSTLTQSADHARHADQLARNASSVAIKGGEVVGEVVGTMKDINESSKQIADIISVIDGIAFQTNILALNAAVEAARAGEQGRGFAVVASEVRSLAQRSAEAAKQIKNLITASVERVERGTALVDQAGVTMQEIVVSIKQVSDIIGEITSASIEQNAGIGQVTQAVSEMDHTTQQNAALVEESAAAAESLKGQAQELVSAMAVFNLGDSYVAAAAPPPKRRAEPVPSIKMAKPLARVSRAKADKENEWDEF
jgi:methyl-accepting chemotaxis protein